MNETTETTDQRNFWRERLWLIEIEIDRLTRLNSRRANDRRAKFIGHLELARLGIESQLRERTQ
jgi:hypothetical protein